MGVLKARNVVVRLWKQKCVYASFILKAQSKFIFAECNSLRGGISIRKILFVVSWRRLNIEQNVLCSLNLTDFQDNLVDIIEKIWKLIFVFFNVQCVSVFCLRCFFFSISTVFWNDKGVLLVDFMEHVTTIITDMYWEMLTKLRCAI